MARTIALGAGLFAFWLVLSGYFTPFLLSMGVASSALCVWFAARLGIIDAEAVPLQLRPSLLLYWLWLGREIVKSNIDMAKIILGRRISTSPRFVLVPTSQKSEIGQVIFANSITLTPGTVTVEAGEGTFLIHALNESFSASLADMNARATAVEGL